MKLNSTQATGTPSHVANAFCDKETAHDWAIVQSLEGLDPKSKLSGASQVTLSEAEVRALRRDMQEQENLIQGYQVSRSHEPPPHTPYPPPPYPDTLSIGSPSLQKHGQYPVSSTPCPSKNTQQWWLRAIHPVLCHLCSLLQQRLARWQELLNHVLHSWCS